MNTLSLSSKGYWIADLQELIEASSGGRRHDRIEYHTNSSVIQWKGWPQLPAAPTQSLALLNVVAPHTCIIFLLQTFFYFYDESETMADYRPWPVVWFVVPS